MTGAANTEPALPRELVVAFAAGDRDAFLVVYRAHADPVRRWVARFFQSPFKQEETVLEAWVTVDRLRNSYAVDKGELRPWLRAVVARRCRELLRAVGRRPAASVPVEDVDEALWLDGPGPDDAALRARVRLAVERFAAGLGDEDAKVLRRGRLDGPFAGQAKDGTLKLILQAAADPTLQALAAELLR